MRSASGWFLLVLALLTLGFHEKKAIPRLGWNPASTPLFFEEWQEKGPLTDRFLVGKAIAANILKVSFGRYPTLWGVERAVWLGEENGLPEALVLLYRHWGLLAVLALSGQHVAGLYLVLRVLPFPVSVSRGGLLLFCAAFLFWTSGGVPSMWRTLGTALSLSLLRYRRLNTPPMQLLFSAAAVLLIVSPSLLFRVGFCLSIAATFPLLAMAEPMSFLSALKRYIGISLLLPLLLFPWTAFYFGKVSLWAPLASLLLGWVWDLVLIPIGFLLPALTLLPISPAIWALGERFFSQVFGFQTQFFAELPDGYFSVWRPTVCELSVLGLLCVGSAVKALRYFGKFGLRK
jgi:predicted membrane metal-binding protein